MDLETNSGVTCVIGENNTGKTNLLNAMRLAIDVNLSSQYRQLIEQDIYSGIDTRKPQQVIVSLEFRDYEGNDNEQAMVGCWEVGSNQARLTYRFRPRRPIREAIQAKENPGNNLTLEEYGWELTGGGGQDPTTVKWDEELGSSIRFADLQQFKVVFLPALRDVESDLRRDRVSPIKKLLDVSTIPEAEKAHLVEILDQANKLIEKEKSISKIGTAIKKVFAQTAGDAFKMDVRLGMADPSFSSIARSLNLLFDSEGLKNFDASRNGLGLNNVLYVSMLIHYFEIRVKDPNTSGQLLMIEEPEAHLHPQLQRVLYKNLIGKPFQTILTTHSTHISSNAPIKTMAVMTKKDLINISCANPAVKAGLLENEAQDLERYLDATRSVLLYARKVILVEGPAELFLLPPLVKKVMGVDFDNFGISVVPIHGTHFEVYAKLFNSAAIPKKCAIIADGDLTPSDSNIIQGAIDPDFKDIKVPEVKKLVGLKGAHVNVFYCSTTFEKALTITGMLPVLGRAAEECGATSIAKKIKDGYGLIKSKQKKESEILPALAELVLKTSKRFGKARFAQIASKHIDHAQEIPTYIQEAVTWILA